MSKSKRPDYQKMPVEELIKKRDDLRTSLFQLRLQAGGATIKNLKSIKYAKKDMARLLTAYNQKIKLEQSSGREG
jgi:ribosomal protein L29